MFHLDDYLGLKGMSAELAQARFAQAIQDPLVSKVLKQAMNGSRIHYVSITREATDKKVRDIEEGGIHATITPKNSDMIAYMNQFLCGRNGWRRQTALEDGADHRGLFVFKYDPSQVKLTLGQEVRRWARHHHAYYEAEGREPPTFTPSLFSEK